MTDPRRLFLLITGAVALLLGGIGMFVPVLPTTPFLLLAAFCFARSSQRFYDMLLGNHWLGAYLRNYRSGRGIPLRMKAIAITGLWVTIGMTAARAVSSPWGRLVLVAIALAVTIHLLKIKTLQGHEDSAQASTVTPAEAVEAEET